MYIYIELESNMNSLQLMHKSMQREDVLRSTQSTIINAQRRKREEFNSFNEKMLKGEEMRNRSSSILKKRKSSNLSIDYFTNLDSVPTTTTNWSRETPHKVSTPVDRKLLSVKAFIQPKNKSIREMKIDQNDIGTFPIPFDDPDAQEVIGKSQTIF